MNIFLILAIVMIIFVFTWVVACLVGGAIKSGGMLKLIHHWIRSLSGKIQ